MAFNDQQTINNIRDRISATCSGNAESCSVGYCTFYKTCAKEVYAENGHEFGCKKIKCCNKMVCGEVLKSCAYSNESIAKAASKGTRKIFKALASAELPEIAQSIIEQIGKRFPLEKIKRVRQQKETLLEKLERILGQSIFDHELIKGHHKSISKIKNCTNITEVIEVLNNRHRQVYGKKKILPGSRWLYVKYKGENHPAFRL